MALTYRFYRTARIGTGGLIPHPTKPGEQYFDAYRSALDTYITNDGTGQDFWDWVHDARPVRFALARCESAKHLILVADPNISPLSPEFDTVGDIMAWLDAPANFTPAQQTRIEDDGISLAWTTVGTPRRAIFRYLSRQHVMTQDLRRLKNAVGMGAIGAALDTRMNQLTAGQRQALRNWLEAKGLDTTGIVGTTTVRQVLQFAVETIDWPVLSLGPVTF